MPVRHKVPESEQEPMVSNMTDARCWALRCDHWSTAFMPERFASLVFGTRDKLQMTPNGKELWPDQSPNEDVTPYKEESGAQGSPSDTSQAAIHSQSYSPKRSFNSSTRRRRLRPSAPDFRVVRTTI